jgi:transposase
MEKFFAALPPGVVVGMEACGGAHHWGRVVEKLGHEARLMPAAYVKPYVKRNKNDGRDAEGVCEAMGRPTMRFVPVKSVESQAVLVVHRTRRLLVRQRTMSANAFRSALAEFGIVAAQGLKGLRSLMEALEDPASAIPDQARMPLGVLARQWERLNADICKLETQIVRAAKTDAVARRLMAIPGSVRSGRPPPSPRCRMPACSSPGAILPLGWGSRRASSAPAASSARGASPSRATARCARCSPSAPPHT